MPIPAFDMELALRGHPGVWTSISTMPARAGKSHQAYLIRSVTARIKRPEPPSRLARAIGIALSAGVGHAAR
jgi:hypothetical protein